MAITPLRVLVIDDEKELRASLRDLLSLRGHQVADRASGEEGLELLRAQAAAGTAFDMVLLDVHLPGGRSGLEILRDLRAEDPSLVVLIVTAHGNIRDAVEAMRDGAFDYIEKPVREHEMLDLVERATQARGLAQAVGYSAPKMLLENGEEFVGTSKQMRAVFSVIQRLGQVSTNVLIRGENGTGKELVARAIHFNSVRKDKPFVAVNCGAIPENLIESEFFGHEKGAFTGADTRHIGKFQFAEGGTLFLDEIGDVSPAMQVKLLRVLQERKFTPVGSNREIRCDVRIIAATNRDLEKMIAAHQFRQDLFYRLNVMPIELPPLRERADEIPDLALHFVHKFNVAHHLMGTDREILGVREESLQALKHYAWPGNIRELENAIERAFVLETSRMIQLQSLPEAVSRRPGQQAEKPWVPEPPSPDAPNYTNQKEQFERDFIVRALTQFGGRINQTVAHAGIPKNTLLRKMRKYGIKPADYS